MPKRALIVIDVQNEYFDGALQVSHPQPETSLANIGRAMDAATAAGIPVIVVRQAQIGADTPVFAEGSHAAQLHPEVERRASDYEIEKQLPGSFTGTNLDEIVSSTATDCLTIVGYMTHMCVDTTARQAAHRGLKVEILRDATGTLALENPGGSATAEELHRATLVAQGQFFADVLGVDEWLGRIEDGSGSTEGA